MAIRSLRFGWLLAAACSILFSVSATAETYVVPVWAADLPASDGRWWAQALIINPHPFDVTWRVTDVYPLATESCAACAIETAPVFTVAPGAVQTLVPPSLLAGQRLVAGAIELESSHAVNIHTVAYRQGAPALVQRLDVARGWLDAGVHRISSMEFNTDGRLNAFVTNPTDTALDVSLWMMNRAENEVRATVAPRSTRVIGLPAPLCGGTPCSFPAGFPPTPFRVSIESSGRFMAVASSATRNWAVFSLPDSIPPH